MDEVSGEELAEQLQSLDEYVFEHFVADLWELLGWDTRVTRGSGDRGIDVIAVRDTPYDQKALIQAKRYGSSSIIGSPAIQQYASLRQQEDNVDFVVIVTTNRFSKQAMEVAKDLNVKLIDNNALGNIITSYGTNELVHDYFHDQIRLSNQNHTDRADKANRTGSLDEFMQEVETADIDDEEVNAPKTDIGIDDQAVSQQTSITKDGKYMTIELVAVLTQMEISPYAYTRKDGDTRRFTVFFEVHNKSSQVMYWNATDNSTILADDGYSYESGNSVVLSDKLPPRWESSKTALEPGIRTKTVLPLNEMPPDTTPETLIYTQSVAEKKNRTHGRIVEKNRYEFDLTAISEPSPPIPPWESHD